MANMGNIAKSIGNMGVSTNPNNSWMVYFMDNPNLKLDDAGYTPHFRKSPKCIFQLSIFVGKSRQIQQVTRFFPDEWPLIDGWQVGYEI